VSKDVPHCPFLRFEVTMVACVWGGLRKTPLLLSMQWHERSDQHHDQHWSHANNFLSRRVLRSTMATRLLRRGIPLSVQSHNSWVDFGRPSFWITLQISQFMVRSLFPACFAYPLVLVFDLPLFDNPSGCRFIPYNSCHPRRVMCGLHAGRPCAHSDPVAGKVADGIPPLPLLTSFDDSTGNQRRRGDKWASRT